MEFKRHDIIENEKGVKGIIDEVIKDGDVEKYKIFWEDNYFDQKLHSSMGLKKICNLVDELIAVYFKK
jgi:hypothetical protein